ncbi:MAG: pantetheine-phosphate adenylyltransferase [Nitrospinales bacterium]
MKTKRTAIYPGTFDPVTIGHIDIMTRALKLFDKLIVAVAHNPKKSPLFSLEDRVRFIRETVQNLDHIEVLPFNNLLIDFAAQHNARVIIRGLRAVTDFEFELQMGLMNRNLNEEVETMFMIPSQEYSFLSSNFVKEIARHGGDIDNFVPQSVLKSIEKLKP